MKNAICFVLGLLLGGLLLSLPTIHAAGAKIVGSGYINGVTVEKDGDEICSAVYYHPSTKELECDE